MNHSQWIICLAVAVFAVYLAVTIFSSYLLTQPQFSSLLLHQNESFANDNGEVSWHTKPLQIGQFDPKNPIELTQTPSQQLKLLIYNLGKPDFIDTAKDGMAYWKGSTLSKQGYCFERVMIYDRPTDYIVARVYWPLSDESNSGQLINNLGTISSNIEYDPVQHHLKAYSTTLRLVVLYLLAGCKYLSGDLTPPQCRNFIASNLSKLISSSSSYSPEVYHIYLSELCDLLNSHSGVGAGSINVGAVKSSYIPSESVI